MKLVPVIPAEKKDFKVANLTCYHCKKLCSNTKMYMDVENNNTYYCWCCAGPFLVKSGVPEVGDRVARKTCFEDGTWYRLGDSCIKDSPVIQGTVIQIIGRNISVKFDDGNIKTFLPHGLEKIS